MRTAVPSVSLSQQALKALRWSVPFWIFAAVGLPLVIQSNIHHYALFTLIWSLVLLPGCLLGLIVGVAEAPWYLVLSVICLGQYLGIYAVIRVRAWLKARVQTSLSR